MVRKANYVQRAKLCTRNPIRPMRNIMRADNLKKIIRIAWPVVSGHKTSVVVLKWWKSLSSRILEDHFTSPHPFRCPWIPKPCPCPRPRTLTGCSIATDCWKSSTTVHLHSLVSERYHDVSIHPLNAVIPLSSNLLSRTRTAYLLRYRWFLLLCRLQVHQSIKSNYIYWILAAIRLD